MKIAIASDHAGYELKEFLIDFLKSNDYEIHDYGATSLDSVDYPDYGIKVGKLVASKEYDYGIVICGTGVGISISANKVKGIRCALVNDATTAKLTKLHNNSNVLALGGQIIGKQVAKDIVSIWLQTEFEGGRHERRINKISEYEVNKNE